MSEIERAFLLPLPGWPRAVFTGDFGYDRAQALLRTPTPTMLERGIAERCPSGRDAPGDDRLRAHPSASAWLHACPALAASDAGFLASWLHLLRAAAEQADWTDPVAVFRVGRTRVVR